MKTNSIKIYTQCLHHTGVTGSFASKNGKFTNVYKDLYELFTSIEYNNLKLLIQ